MKLNKWVCCLCLAGLFSFQSCRYEKIEPFRGECSEEVSYVHKINPLIQVHCATPGCHVAGFVPGDFTLYSVVKAKADNGHLRLFVLQLRSMPPDSSITEEERQMIGCWIEQGAKNN